jgi:prephenate dehydrogenase
MTIGIIGYGSFGAFLHELSRTYLPSAEIRIFSSRAKTDGKAFFSLEDVCKADVLLLCVPISAFEETLARIRPFITKHTIVVDVSTVKTHTLELLKKEKGMSYIATHPMFGPESFKKQGKKIDGFRVAVCGHSLPKKAYERLREALESAGLIVVDLSAEQHDRLIAETLFLTHLMGQVVTDGGFDRTPIDTVSFGFLMHAVESVRGQDALFKDVYRYNPYCKDVLSQFRKSLEKIEKNLREGQTL